MDAKSPVIITYTQSINPATALPLDTPLFRCPAGAEYEVVEVTEEHTVAGGDGSAVTADLKITRSGTVQAPSAGTSLLTSTFDLKSTANTPVKKFPGSGISPVKATRTLRAGDRLSLDYGGTLTALAGMCLTISLAMTRPATRR
jgi:hypothetical protein